MKSTFEEINKVNREKENLVTFYLRDEKHNEHNN